MATTMRIGHNYWPLPAILLLALFPAAPNASANSFGVCYSQANGVVLPLAGSCTSYIYCLGEMPFTLPCPMGTGFSTAAGGCVAKFKSDCVPPTTLTITTTTTKRTTDTAATFTNPPTDTITESTPSCTTLPAIDAHFCVGRTLKVYSYPGNCTGFIMCVAGCPQLVFCPPGKLFNSRLRICDFPDAVDCEGATTTSAPTTSTTMLPLDVNDQSCVYDTLLPYEKDCSMFIQCAGGVATMHQCPSGWFFNAEFLICDDQDETTCSQTSLSIATTPAPGPAARCANQPVGQTFPIENDCTHYTICTDSATYITLKCPSNNYYSSVTGKCGPNISPTACRDIPTTATMASTSLTPTTTAIAADGGDHHLCSSSAFGHLVAYPDDCRKYVQCAYPVPVAFNCSADLHFNEADQRCGSHAESNCTVPPTQTTIVAPGETTTAPSTGVCSGATAGETRPYLANCQMIIRCSGDGSYMLELCGWKKNYDAILGECSTAAAADACRQEVITTMSTSSSSTAGPPIGVCSEQPLGSAVPYPDNCTKYIICQLPIPVAYMCGGNLEFNAAQAQCMAAEKANCSTVASTTSPTTKTTTQEPSTGPCYGKPYGTVLPYPNNCSKYIECLQPIAVGHTCPDGQEFNSNRQECLKPEWANCSKPITATSAGPTTLNPANVCAEEPDGTILPYPVNCSQYIICMGGREQYIPCLGVTFFNPQTGICDHGSSATACRGSDSTMTTPIGMTTLDPFTPNVCCGEALNTRLPYPGDCGKFIICQHPIPTIVICAPDYSYDKETQECAHASDGHCLASTTTTNDRPDTTSSTVSITPDPPTSSYLTTEQAAITTSTATTMAVTAATTVTTATIATIATTTSDPPIIHVNEGCKNVPSGTQIAYPGDCTKYNFCFGGNSVVLDCGSHWYFNPQMRQCVPPSSYKCPW